MGGRLVHTMALLAQVARVAQLIRALSSACVDGQRLADSAVPASSCTFGAEAPVLLLATTRGSNLVSENPTSAVSDNDGVVKSISHHGFSLPHSNTGASCTAPVFLWAPSFAG